VPISIYTRVLRQFFDAHPRAAGGTKCLLAMQNCLAAPCSIVLRHVETDNAGGPEPVTILSCMGLVDAKDSHRALFRDRRQGARRACSWRTRGFSSSFKAAAEEAAIFAQSASVASRKGRRRASCCQRLVVLLILTSGNPKRVRATFH
jgi:hypothetical protein